MIKLGKQTLLWLRYKILAALQLIDNSHTVRAPRFLRNISKTIASSLSAWLVRGIDGSACPSSSEVRDGPQLPSWVRQFMDEQSKFEPMLATTPAKLDQYRYYNVPIRPSAGEVYHKMRALIPDDVTHVVVAPWVKRGGADLGVLHHLMALDRHKCKSILITTQRDESPWLKRVPTSIHHLDFGGLAVKCTTDDQVFLLARLLIQLQPSVIHNVNSNLMWLATKKFGESISQKSMLFASVFCDDFSSVGEQTGYARIFLPHTYNILSKVLSDNPQYPSVLQRDYGFPEDIFQVAYFPSHEQYAEMVAGTKVLWAGRLDAQKRVDILAEIASAMPHLYFDVYGCSLLGVKSSTLRKLDSLSNINQLGSYDDFHSITHEQYGVFLYTSAWDGLPNILLEATSSGLPIVAPDVGGVASFINDESGYLVKEIDMIPSYVQAISCALRDRQKAQQKVKCAQRILGERHTQDRFHDALRKIKYFSGRDDEF